MSRRISKMFRRSAPQHDIFSVILRDTSPEEAPFKQIASWEKEQILKGPGFCAYQPRQAGIRSVSFIAVLFAASCQRCQVTAPDMPAQPGR